MATCKHGDDANSKKSGKDRDDFSDNSDRRYVPVAYCGQTCSESDTNDQYIAFGIEENLSGWCSLSA